MLAGACLRPAGFIAGKTVNLRIRSNTRHA